jgi:hypothetical protein
MEGLIRQVFLHVEVIGPQVAEGHYDLVGPNGEIILPGVWETMIEPGWPITMHMWPFPDPPNLLADNPSGGPTPAFLGIGDPPGKHHSRPPPPPQPPRGTTPEITTANLSPASSKPKKGQSQTSQLMAFFGKNVPWHTLSC